MTALANLIANLIVHTPPPTSKQRNLLIAALQEIQLGVSYGSLFVVDNADAVTLGPQNTFVPINIGWQTSEELNIVLDAPNGTISPILTSEYKIACSISYIPTDGGTNTIEFQIFKNGVEIPRHKVITNTNNSLPNSVTLIGIDTLAANDVIAVMARCTTSEIKIVVTNANFTIFAI